MVPDMSSLAGDIKWWDMVATFGTMLFEGPKNRR